jgi:hypothetical protein
VTVYAWPTGPGWSPSRFEMRVLPNTRTFIGPYTPTTQVLDLLGERWVVGLDLPPDSSLVLGAAREAFFDRLKGPANQVAIWNLRFPAPNGTTRSTDTQAVSVVNGSLAAVTVKNASNVTVNVVDGTPVLRAALAVGANAATLGAIPGRTLLAGDMVGIGGQTVRLMADAVADGAGAMAIEFQPRMRAAVAVYSQPNTDKPTVNCILKAEGVPTVYRPGMVEGASLELIEAL